MVYVKNAKYLKEYEIWLEFSDGSQKVVDLKPAIMQDQRALMCELQKIEYFKHVKYDSEGATICWDNGVDFAPEYLYNCGKIVDVSHSMAS